MATNTSRGFDMGRVAGRTFGTIGKNIIPFAALSVLLLALPQLLSGWVSVQLLTGDISQKAIFSLLSWPLSFLAWVCGQIAYGALVSGTVASIDGKPVNLSDCLTIGRKHWFRVFLVGLVVGIVAGVGFIFLIVPGIMLLLRWTVAIPVQVIENKGVNASMARSADLTKGHRWAIFGLGLVYTIAVWIIGAAVFAISGVFSSGFAGLETALRSPIALMVVTPLVNLIGALISSAGLTAIYVELRGAPAADTVAEVFS
jgi:hypothetical protein